MIEGPYKITRNELAQFLPSQRAIRAFEQIFDLIPSTLNESAVLIEEASINAQNADSKAVQALSSISRIADAVEFMALAPRTATPNFEGNLLPPLVSDKRKRYGVFHSTQIQTAAAINTAYPMTLNVTDLSFGVYTGTPNSRVYIDTEGIYNFQFSAQLTKTTGGVALFYIWARLNGIDIPDSATKIRIQGNNGETVGAWNFVLELKAGDYFELVWSTDDLNCQIFASAASSPVPAIPSVILTVTDNIS
jgi:hypothetical protein